MKKNRSPPPQMGLSNTNVSLPVFMSDTDFRELSRLVEDHLGIKMPISKRTMLQARLLRRLRALGMQTFAEYSRCVAAPQAAERTNFFDIVTTNMTAFLREPAHFEFLERVVLPEMMQSHGAGVRRKLLGWSAGCSTGQEIYTMAMVLSEHSARTQAIPAGFQLLGTDVSTRVLRQAQTAVYDEAAVEAVPLPWRQKYLLKSVDRNSAKVRIVPRLREAVTFRQVNFMNDNYAIGEQFDFIFCRNVIIYFERKRQEVIIQRLCRNLVRGGYLFVGHSESLHGFTLGLQPVGRSVYRLMQQG